MKEDFVTYDIAVKLKEKGYPQSCSGKYSMVGACYFNDGRFYEDGCIANVEDCCSAPTISQVLKWLRQEKKILVEIALSPEGYRHIIYTGLCCTNTSSVSYYSFDGFYNHENNYMTYEQAAIAGIEYVIDNLI